MVSNRMDAYFDAPVTLPVKITPAQQGTRRRNGYRRRGPATPAEETLARIQSVRDDMLAARRVLVALQQHQCPACSPGDAERLAGRIVELVKDIVADLAPPPPLTESEKAGMAQLQAYADEVARKHPQPATPTARMSNVEKQRRKDLEAFEAEELRTLQNMVALLGPAVDLYQNADHLLPMLRGSEVVLESDRERLTALLTMAAENLRVWLRGQEKLERRALQAIAAGKAARAGHRSI